MSFGRRGEGNSQVISLASLRDPAAEIPDEFPDEDYRPEAVDRAVTLAAPRVMAALEMAPTDLTRGEKAEIVGRILDGETSITGQVLYEKERRDTITRLLNQAVSQKPEADKATTSKASHSSVEAAAERVQPLLMDRMDVGKAAEMPRGEMATQITDLVAEILAEEKLQVNLIEQRDLVTRLLNDMLGLGPLEPLLADEAVTDIMVNGPKQVFIERKGRLELAPVQFRDNAHVLNVAQRIVSGTVFLIRTMFP